MVRVQCQEAALFTLTAASLRSASSAWRWFVLGDDGGETVGDGAEGVGGSAVSRHTRRSISCRPSAAARVSRSSSTAEISPVLPSSSAVFWAWRLGDDGGEQVGDGDRGVGGRLRSTASCIAAPRPPAPPSNKKGNPTDGPAPETGDLASGGGGGGGSADDEEEVPEPAAKANGTGTPLRRFPWLLLRARSAEGGGASVLVGGSITILFFFYV